MHRREIMGRPDSVVPHAHIDKRSNGVNETSRAENEIMAAESYGMVAAGDEIP